MSAHEDAVEDAVHAEMFHNFRPTDCVRLDLSVSSRRTLPVMYALPVVHA